MLLSSECIIHGGGSRLCCKRYVCISSQSQPTKKGMTAALPFFCRASSLQSRLDYAREGRVLINQDCFQVLFESLSQPTHTTLRAEDKKFMKCAKVIIRSKNASSWLEEKFQAASDQRALTPHFPGNSQHEHQNLMQCYNQIRWCRQRMGLAIFTSGI